MAQPIDTPDQMSEVMQKFANTLTFVLGDKYGFALFIYEKNGQEMHYISDADREGMFKALREFLAMYQ